MAAKKVAIVTGSNKGIGLATVKGLASKFDGDVFLTARNEERGYAAVQQLEKQGLKVHFHQLDIVDRKSIENFRNFIKDNYGGIDVLVNNAGIDAERAFKHEPMHIHAQMTIKTNYFGTKQTCEILFPILKPGARVVNVSSCMGFLLRINGDEPAATKLREKFASSDSTLTAPELDDLMNSFIEAAKDGTYKEKGWAESAYAVSKVGVSALTRIQQRELLNDSSRKDIVVNHVHPGYVDTDLNSHKGPLTTAEGAKSSIYGALLPPGTAVKGKYIWYDCQIVDWVNGPEPTRC